MTISRMSRAASRLVAPTALALSFCLAARLAEATAIVQATLANGEQFDTLAAVGDFSVKSFSQQGTAKNVTRTPTFISNGVPIAAGPTTYMTSMTGAAIPVRTGVDSKGNPTYTNFGQTFVILAPNGRSNIAKGSLKIRNDEVGVLSSTGSFTGEGAAVVGGAGMRSILAEAERFDPNSPPGAAAGQAVDPFTVTASGSPLAYAPTIGGTVQLDAANESGGALYWAADSFTFTSDSIENFADDGTPLNDTLWYLSLGADEPTNSLSDMEIDFELDPLALQEIIFPSSFLASLGAYSDPTTEAALIDKAIDKTVASALSLTGDTVSLPSGFDPFPTGTTFSPEGGSVQYADGVDAGITAPEPGTGPLLIAGLAGLALALVTRRRRACDTGS
jgi:hypothetical protein